MKSVLALAAPLALVAGLFAAAPAYADERRCAGTIRAVSIDGDVVVPQGKTCTLVGTRVDGSVKVHRNARLVAQGVRVGGNVQAENHRSVKIVARATSKGTVRSVVGGSIQLKQGGGGQVLRVSVGSDLQLFSNKGRYEVRQNRVKGNLQCKSNRPAPVGSGNVVQGNKEDQCRRF